MSTSIAPAPLISLQQINVRIDDREILKQVDFELEPNEIVTIIGPNGAGKSTLIKVLLGIVKPNSGQIKKVQSSSLLTSHKNLILHIASLCVSKIF